MAGRSTSFILVATPDIMSNRDTGETPDYASTPVEEFTISDAPQPFPRANSSVPGDHADSVPAPARSTSPVLPALSGGGRGPVTNRPPAGRLAALNRGDTSSVEPASTASDRADDQAGDDVNASADAESRPGGSQQSSLSPNSRLQRSRPSPIGVPRPTTSNTLPVPTAGFTRQSVPTATAAGAARDDVVRQSQSSGGSNHPVNNGSDAVSLAPSDRSQLSDDDPFTGPTPAALFPQTRDNRRPASASMYGRAPADPFAATPGVAESSSALQRPGAAGLSPVPAAGRTSQLLARSPFSPAPSGTFQCILRG